MMSHVLRLGRYRIAGSSKAVFVFPRIRLPTKSTSAETRPPFHLRQSSSRKASKLSKRSDKKYIPAVLTIPTFDDHMRIEENKLFREHSAKLLRPLRDSSEDRRDRDMMKRDQGEVEEPLPLNEYNRYSSADTDTVLDKWSDARREMNTMKITDPGYRDPEASARLELFVDTMALIRVAKVHHYKLHVEAGPSVGHHPAPPLMTHGSNKYAYVAKDSKLQTTTSTKLTPLLLSIQAAVEKDDALGRMSVQSLTNIIKSLMMLGGMGSSKRVGVFNGYAWTHPMINLDESVVPLLKSILRKMDRNELARIAKEGRAANHANLCKLLIELCYDSQLWFVAEPVTEGFFDHLRSEHFAIALFQQGKKYNSDFSAYLDIASSLALNVPKHKRYRESLKFSDPPIAHRTHQNMNMKYGKVTARNIAALVFPGSGRRGDGWVETGSGRRGFDSIQTQKEKYLSLLALDFCLHHRYTSSTLEDAYIGNCRKLGVNAQTLSGVFFATAFATYGWSDSLAYFKEFLGKEKNIYGIDRTGEGTWDVIGGDAKIYMRDLYHLKIMWAMTVLGVIDHEDLREPVEKIWKVHMESTGLVKKCRGRRLVDEINHYSEMFERLYSVEGKNEYILNNLPTLPHPDKIVVKPLFEEFDDSSDSSSSEMPLSEKISSLFSMEVPAEYDEFMKKGEPVEEEIPRRGGTNPRSRVAAGVSATLDLLKLEHRRDFNPRLDMKGRPGAVVEAIASWGAIDIINETRGRVAIRIIPAENTLRDVLYKKGDSPLFVSDGYIKAQNRILESEGIAVVEIFIPEWFSLRKTVNKPINEVRKEFLENKLKDQAGIDLEWYGAKLWRNVFGD